MTASTATPLARAVVTETVRLVEASGPLDDSAELHQAFRTQPTRAAQYGERAWLLGERLGLPAELTRWRHVGWGVVLVLAALMALSALAMARAVVGEGRGINAMAAFVSVLGLHMLMLALWLASLAWAALGRGMSVGGFSLGALALWLTGRLPLERGPHSVTVARAATALLQRHRLMGWAFGAISHTIWALAFVIVLGVLAFGFAFHAYRLSWETTILSADFFQRFVHLTGLLPSLLGFPVPDAAAVQRVGNAGVQSWLDASSQREWAWWLLGCVFVYGLLPRALLAAFSFWRWRAGVGRMAAVDEADPYVRRIYARLDALEPPPQVVDIENPAPQQSSPPAPPPGTPGTLALIGFELPPELPWPPPGLPPLEAGEQQVLTQRISGSAAERQAVVAALARLRPWRLVVVCHALSSPDRGTARFLREAARQVQVCELALVAAQDPAAGSARWAEWLRAEQLVTIKCIAENIDATRGSS